MTDGLMYDRWFIFAEVWKLADYLQMPLLQNLAMERLQAEFEYDYKFRCRELVRIWYTGTSEGAALRKFVADTYGLRYRKVGAWGRGLLDEDFGGFLVDVHFSREELKTPIESIDRSQPFYDISRYLVDEKPMLRMFSPFVSRKQS